MDFLQFVISKESSEEIRENFYKNFIQYLRRMYLEETYILMHTDISPKLTNYVKNLDDVEFKDGSYHTYYGKVKSAINSFILYWIETIDKAIKDADKYKNTVSKDELLDLMEQTIFMHQKKQIDFGNQYLPVSSQLQRKTYEEIENKYKDFMNRLNEMKMKIENLQRKESIESFAQEQFPYSVKKENEVFVFTHTYIALKLATNLYEIRVSLEEILLRVKNNLKKMQNDYVESLNTMLQGLYDKNKELLETNRRHHSSEELFEIKHCIKKLRGKIKLYLNDESMRRLQEEVDYWENKLEEFKKITTTLAKLRTEYEKMSKEEQKWNSLKTTEIPGYKLRAWENMGENIRRRIANVNDTYIEAAKTLITFFSVRGPSRMLYSDNTGPYYIDMYGHQVYFFDYGQQNCHVSCDGTFERVTEDNPYFFDNNGRYILDEKNKKIYQAAPCCSSYKLDDDNLFKQISKDCGHSEEVNKNCRNRVRDPNDVEILPTTEEINIKRTLQPEVVKYLWDSFGYILPDVLNDVAQYQPKNPIHYFAHRLLYHKYNRTFGELQQKRREAEVYRKGILQGRKDKAAVESRLWKAKQVKRRKPEESDDTQEQAAYAAQTAAYNFINSLNYYNY